MVRVLPQGALIRWALIIYSGAPVSADSHLLSMPHRQTENNPGQFGFTTNFPDEVRT